MSQQLPVTRRTVLVVGAATVGVAVTGCGDNGQTGATPAAGSPDPTTATGGTAEPSDSEAPAGLIAAADVPVGGSASATAPDGSKLLVAQPEAGQFVAFDATCTHMGCTVAPDGEQLRCPCHGSVYDAFTGEVESGPAPAPLSEVPVAVEGGQVVQA